MVTKLLLLLCLTVHVFAKEPPDVDCLVVHLKHVHCSWNQQGPPGVNYTFYGWFYGEIINECATYLSEKGTIVGCDQPYQESLKRFSTFYTKLVHGNNSFLREHDLKKKVKLYPPTNQTIQMQSDSNLWFYWNQTASKCVKSEVRYRVNNKEWDTSRVSIDCQSFCINLPSNSSLYELQVRSKLGEICGESLFWSDWSEPVVWGSYSSTDTNKMTGSMSVWTPMRYVLGILTLILLIVMLLHYERVRIILLPVVPKPSLISHDIQDWHQLSKGLKESFNYNECACPVSEFCHVSESDSESSDSDISFVTTDQTGCSLLIPVEESDLSTPCSSSTSATLVPSEKAEQVSVVEAS